MSSTPITRDPLLDSLYGEELELNEVFTLVYDELRRLSRFYMQRERGNHTLQPTALVHEAYMRLAKQEKHQFMNRTQFIALAANMMRRILVNHAVNRNRQKREGENVRITLERATDVFQDENFDLVDLDDALRNLTKLDQRTARVFELRFFGGLTIEETAEILDVSAATTKREWKVAALFLQRELYGNHT